MSHKVLLNERILFWTKSVNVPHHRQMYILFAAALNVNNLYECVCAILYYTFNNLFSLQKKKNAFGFITRN